MLKVLSIIALIGLFFGCALSLTAMVTSSWMILLDNSHMGLFYHCNHSTCVTINFTLNHSAPEVKIRQGHFKTVRGLVISGMIIGVCGFLTALGFVIDALRHRGVNSLALLRSSVVLNMLAGVATVSGPAVFSATLLKDPTWPGASLGYSYMICMGAGVGFLALGLMVLIGGPRKVSRPTSTRRQVSWACLAPPPHYSPPTEAYLRSLLMQPPAYDDGKTPPPSYDEESIYPPSYEESSSMSCPS